MTSKATPITNIDSSPSAGENLQMPIIQDILNEIGHEETDFPSETMITHDRNEMNAPRLNYQMDPNINPLPTDNYTTMGPTAMNSYQNSLVQNNKTTGILNVILKEVRLPVLVILLYTIFRRVRLDNLLVKKLPFAMNNGNINVVGTLLTATVFGGLFWAGKFAFENININI